MFSGDARLGSSQPADNPVVPMCGGGDLGRGLAFSEGGGGGAIGVLEVENVGPASCVMDGVPGVTLRSAVGHPLAVDQTRSQVQGRRFVLRPGQRAQAAFSWANYCGDSGAAYAQLVWGRVGLKLRPSADGWMSRPRCDD